jgi:hypothetical protein
METLWLLRNLAGRRRLFRWSIRAAAIILLLALLVAALLALREAERIRDYGTDQSLSMM